MGKLRGVARVKARSMEEAKRLFRKRNPTKRIDNIVTEKRLPKGFRIYVIPWTRKGLGPSWPVFRKFKGQRIRGSFESLHSRLDLAQKRKRRFERQGVVAFIAKSAKPKPSPFAPERKAKFALYTIPSPARQRMFERG